MRTTRADPRACVRCVSAPIFARVPPPPPPPWRFSLFFQREAHPFLVLSVGPTPSQRAPAQPCCVLSSLAGLEVGEPTLLVVFFFFLAIALARRIPPLVGVLSPFPSHPLFFPSFFVFVFVFCFCFCTARRVLSPETPFKAGNEFFSVNESLPHSCPSATSAPRSGSLPPPTPPPPAAPPPPPPAQNSSTWRTCVSRPFWSLDRTAT